MNEDLVEFFSAQAPGETKGISFFRLHAPWKSLQ